jgi:CHAD domain-containing protein
MSKERRQTKFAYGATEVMVKLNGFVAGSAPAAEGLHRLIGRSLDESWKGYRRDFRRCRAKFSEASVHQLRVESRRLLALLGLLETLLGQSSVAEPRRLLKKSLRRLARLRDAQVQLMRVEAKLRRFSSAKAFHSALRKRERRLIREGSAQMHRARLTRIKASMATLREDVRRLVADQPHEGRHWEALWCAVNQAFDRVAELRGLCSGDDLRTIHRLRIAFKRFRYKVELLRPVLPGVTKRHLTALRAFQTRLGEIQDAGVLMQTLGKFSRKRPEDAANLQGFRQDAKRQLDVLVQKFLLNAGRIHKFWPPPSSKTARFVGQNAAPTPRKPPRLSGNSRASAAALLRHSTNGG